MSKFQSGISKIDVGDIFRKLKRRKLILFAAMIFITGLAIVVVNLMTPKYNSVSQVLIDPRQQNVVDIESVLSGLPQDAETIESEIRILRSRKLAERVITKLKLYEYPEFKPGTGQPSLITRVLNPASFLPESWVDFLGLKVAETPKTPEEELERQRVQVIDKYLNNLSLSRSGRSRVIEISFTSTSPRIAALVANTVADLYIVEQLEAKFDATKMAAEWLNVRLADLKEKVAASERAVEVFRQKSGLIQGNGITLASQQISELNSQLILARTKRAEAQARLSQLERSLNQNGGVEAVAEVLSSPLIQRLREEEAKLLRKSAELSQEFGARHPKMINLRAELEDQRKKIKVEVNKIIQNLRNEVNVAVARERSFRQALAQLEGRVGQLNSREVQLRALEREANANRELYETFLNRFKETGSQGGVQQPDARVISRADISTSPSHPRKKLIVAIAFLFSIFVGIGLVMLVEHLDAGFRSGDQIEEMTGLPALGLIPIISGVKGLTAKPFDYLIENPTSAFTEAVRSLYAGVLLSDVDKPPKTLLLTSSLPSEGKTSLSICLARLVSTQSRKKVVLIDGDIRRPQIHARLELPNKPGLVEYLSGEATFDEILHRDPETDVVTICAGGTSNNPTDILASDAMKSLLAQLAATNDLVIIDSPPVLAVSDPRVLARLADKTVFVVRWAETRREVVRMGLNQVMNAGADMAGVVLSMVNVRRHSQYGYADSGAYYGKYRKYYTS